MVTLGCGSTALLVRRKDVWVVVVVVAQLSLTYHSCSSFVENFGRLINIYLLVTLLSMSVHLQSEFAKKHIMEVSDEELIIISNSNTDEYRQEVIDFAKEELKKRGLIEASKDKSDEIKKQWEEEGKKEKGLSIRWLNFYIKVRLPFGILLGLYSYFGAEP